MIGTLTKDQNELVLRSGLIGRIGCQADKKIYIVPVTYVLNENYVYAHSWEGQKIEIMRKNPEVCFEVDSIESMTNWRCVIVHGKFEEIKSAAAQEKALKK